MMNIKALQRMKTSPIEVIRSTRTLDMRLLTSLPAGKMVPLAAFPLLREDALPNGRLRLSWEMMETAEILMNAVNVNVKAYLVPNLALPRFSGMDELNRSYEGIPEEEGGDVTPYFVTDEAGPHGSNAIHKYMGLHARPDQTINMAYVEAYNAIWNFRAANRSPDITKRLMTNTDLAPAFWQHEQYAHIVPDFDQAAIDGEVPLNIVGGKMPIKGLGFDTTDVQWNPAGRTIRYSDGSSEVTVATAGSRHQAIGAGGRLTAKEQTIGGNPFPDIFAEMAENGVTVSLANIELARKTQAFARLRQQYEGHDDEYIIDLLMDGLTIPEQMWRQPVLLADRSTIFGMAKRYASDSGNLTESVVSGMTGIDLALHVPRVPCGGVVMIIAEVTPEQLFEREKEAYLHTLTVDKLPHYLRDTLDPEKVEVVTNDYVDIDHDTPNDTFGFAPLNHAWSRTGPKIGGRFFRPEVDAGFDEDRQRIWAVETQNPKLSEDFYLCTTMHTKPFVVTNQDPFEVVMRGDVTITGNTVFGQNLIEATDSYDKVMAQAPMERIEKAD